jgi:starch-binding outer membrane protein SusE/F
MKKYINKLLVLCMVAVLGTSCDEDAALTYLSEVNFPGAIEATPGTIQITAVNRYQSVLTVSWPEVEFPVDAPVTYGLQVDLPADTSGDGAWSHAVSVTAGEAALSKSFLGDDLNSLALRLGLPQDVPGQLVIRATATLDRTVYSEPVTITVTPYVPVITITEIYLPGGYQGWNPATAAKLKAIDVGVFQGYATFPAGALSFKVTPEMNWDTFYGSTGGNGIAEHDDDDLTVPAAGTYQITVNLNTLTFTAVPYSYGVIGPAQAGGWNVDSDMSFDHVAEQWTFTGDLVPGALKFRLNDEWTINYGSANGENGVLQNGTVLLDNQGAHTINEAGNYTVTFKVNANPATAAYSVTRN